MSSYFPSIEDGYLPLCVLIVGLTAIGNVIQCYTTLSYSQRIYSGPGASTGRGAGATSPVTPLSARTFGTWNLAVGIARIYAAYNLHERSWYQMSMWTNVIGLLHFGSEAFVFGSCRPRGPWFAPVTVASLGLLWHILQYDNYINN